LVLCPDGHQSTRDGTDDWAHRMPLQHNNDNVIMIMMIMMIMIMMIMMTMIIMIMMIMIL
jgi:hypothetical protein